MDMTGEYRIAAPRQRVWEALNDTETLRQCIPGCEEIEKLSDVEMTAKVVAKVGPVKARFGGKVTLSDLDPPNGYTISGEGTGGAAGFAKGGATVKLSDVPEGTLLAYTVKANVGGKLAQIGSRLIDSAARKMADDFFARFSELVAAAAAASATPAMAAAPAASEPSSPVAPAAAPAATTPSTPAAPPTVPGAGAPKGKRLSPLVWVIGLTVIVIIILALATR
jgi:carbon monoxide dehydrogenase subunit G